MKYEYLDSLLSGCFLSPNHMNHPIKYYFY